MRLDIDHEVIGCVIANRAPPAFEKIRAHNRQEQQHRQAQPEGNDLHGAGAAAAGDVGQAVTPRHADPGSKAAHQCHKTTPDEIKRSRNDDDATQQDRKHARVADRVVQQRRDSSKRQTRDQQSRWCGRHHVVPQHTQRRRVA